MTLIRPGDPNETSYAWKVALQRTDGPVALALTRQKLPLIDRSTFGPAEGVECGAYTLAETHPSPDLILMASGSEVQLIMEAYETLAREQVRVRIVSMPSWEVFERQSKEYRESILPKAVTKRIAVEAGSPMGWHKYVGDGGDILGIETFGASAPYERLFEEFGLTTSHVLSRARLLLDS